MNDNIIKFSRIKKPKIIFFDYDNTLSRMGDMYQPNYDTLIQLHEQGIKVVIATGRGMGMMPKEVTELVEQGIISAYIFMNGQYARTKDSVISSYPLSYRECETIVNVCKKYQLKHKFDSATFCAWSEHTDFFDFLKAQYPNFMVDPEHYRNHEVYQISFIKNDDTVIGDVQKALLPADLALTFWSDKGADILPKWSSKLVGMKDVCKYFGATIQETMAFGDGLNDMEMLKHAGTGVAMGDGYPQIKAVADYVTGTIEENGIQTALHYYGVIENS